MTMAGADHGLLPATIAEAERLGVAGAIEFPGYILPLQKLQAFADHDLFLNTNVVDNMPVSVLEVAAAGIVPVATEVGGIPALLTDGHDSVLVPTGDDEAMARAVVDLLRDPERYAALARNARTLAVRSSWPEVRARWEDELRLVLPGCSLP
jgi:phenylacetate-CoA ligase